jgi:hypothetical protein
MSKLRFAKTPLNFGAGAIQTPGFGGIVTRELRHFLESTTQYLLTGRCICQYN